MKVVVLLISLILFGCKESIKVTNPHFNNVEDVLENTENNNSEDSEINTPSLPKGYLSQDEQKRELNPNNTYKALFRRGAYNYRIPAMITTKKGTILVATDRRHKNTEDLGKGNIIDVVIKRSFDLGETWSDDIVFRKANSSTDSYGDSFFVNCYNGDIILGVINNPGIQENDKGVTTLYRSSDEGLTWREVYTIGPSTYKSWVGLNVRDSVKGFVASGQGIQLKSQKRLMFAYLQWNTANRNYGKSVAIISSDDDGNNWRALAHFKPYLPDNSIDEAKLVELSDGKIMMNFRRDVDKGGRGWALSVDKGHNFVPQGVDPEVDDPGNNADLVRYEFNGKPIIDEKYILFVNANKRANGSYYDNRRNHYVRLTKNEFNGGNGSQSGKYSYAKQLVNGGDRLYQGYSAITVLPDGTIAVVSEESSSSSAYSYDIAFRRFNLYWLSDGREYVDYNKWEVVK